MTDRRLKTCFISSPAGTDLSVLTASLERHGYAVIAPSLLASGQRWIDALMEGIRRADIVVGVFAPGTGANNVAFELGYAAALGKRVLVLASSKAGELPFAASSLLLVRAEPDAQEAIDFALDSLPEASSVRTETRIESPHTAAAPELVAAYGRQIAAAGNEAELMAVLREVLVDAGVDVVANARFGNRQADFAIWSDELGAYVGNPLIIEVKRELRGIEDVARALAQLTNYLNAASAPWGLLIYEKGPGELIRSQASGASRVLVLSTQELLDGLGRASLLDLIRDLRNRKVHGVGR